MSGFRGNEFIHFQNKHFISQVKSKECELHHSLKQSPWWYGQ